MGIPADLIERLRADAPWARLTTGTDVSFALRVRGGGETVVAIAGGETTAGTTADFLVELGAEDWDAMLSPDVAPRAQHPSAFLAPRGTGAVLGDELAFAQHLQLVRRAVEVARGLPVQPPVRAGDLSQVHGRYVRVRVEEWGTCDVYVEAAGAGKPVLLLHTAGADGRQYHGLLSNEALTEQYRLISFDLPWHGRSNPSWESNSRDYRLTTRSYAECIAGVIAALELEAAPVLVGASMAGAAVIEFAALHPGLIAGVVSCQAGPRVGNRQTPWLRNPRVNQTLHVPEWTYGLMSPRSPELHRDRVWWGYSQGGWGSYERDIAYYSEEWDIDRVAHLFGETTPPVVLMNGEYDYSVPPEATRELLARIPGSSYRAMPELGHFPHAEHPDAFAEHLAAALRTIEQASAARS